jgi:hypothetical protein
MSHRHWWRRGRLLLFAWLLFGSEVAWANSQQNRAASSLSFGAVISGLNFITQPVYVAFPGARWSYGLEYGAGTLSTEEDVGSVNASGEIEVTDFSVFARRFSGNSFNYHVAYTSRTSRADVQATDSQTGGSAQLELHAAVSLLTLGFGNGWAFDSGFELGLDWLTVSLPMESASDVTVTSQSGSMDTSRVRSKYEGRGSDLNLLAALPTFFTIRVGYRF